VSHRRVRSKLRWRTASPAGALRSRPRHRFRCLRLPGVLQRSLVRQVHHFGRWQKRWRRIGVLPTWAPPGLFIRARSSARLLTSGRYGGS